MATSGWKELWFTNHNYLRFDWTQVTQIPQSNTSVVDWTVRLFSDSYGGINSTAIKNGSVTINGVTRNQSFFIGIGFNEEKLLMSGTTEVPHWADGSKTFSYSFSVDFNITFAGEHIGTVSGSGNGALDRIYRAATFTSAPDFTDEQNPTIKYSNPMGSAVSKLEACISSDGYVIQVPYRTIPATGTSYTFNLTDSERATLRGMVLRGTTATFRYYLKTTFEDGTTTLVNSGALNTFTLVAAYPTLSPTVVDTNAATIAVTGDANKLVKYMSSAKVSSGAVAVKGATISSQSITNSAGKIRSGSGNFSAVESGSFVFSVTDNRGLTTTKTVTKTLIEYHKPTISVKADPLEVEAENFTFSISGTFFNGSFGAVDNTCLVSFRYNEDDGEYSGWFALPSTVNSGQFTSKATLTDIDYSKKYAIQVKVTDKLSEAIAEDVALIKPVFDWSKTDFAFNVPVSIEGNPVKDFIIDYGTEAMGTNGTWYWSKWASGKAECYGCRNYGNMGISTVFGDLYKSEGFKQDLPSGLFVANPDKIDISVESTGGTNALWIAKYGTPSAAKTSSFVVVSHASGSTNQVYIGFNVLGRWK